MGFEFVTVFYCWVFGFDWGKYYLYVHLRISETDCYVNPTVFKPQRAKKQSN